MSLKLKNLHILIVEDIAPMRELTSAVLKEQGVGTISYAADGESGYQAFCRLRPDIILTDWVMPNMDGLEMTKMIRTDAGSPDKTIPIIMMTGFGSPHKISLARNAGVTEFLVKPFSATEVSKRIMKVIKSPRDFIITHNFVGPDRRRKKDEGAADDGNNKRIDPEGYTEIIKANHVLQAKVGIGQIPDDALLKSQSLIEKNNFNFAPIAKQFLKQFRDALDIAHTETYTNRKSIERLINPVMQIKANARIFRYELLGDLASIMLNFLENMNELDEDAMAIIEAHHTTLSRIVSDELHGDGGSNGKSFQEELEAACKRYLQSRILRQRKAMQKILSGDTDKI
jgi:two-component system chemotaxis response regulator CheY